MDRPPAVRRARRVEPRRSVARDDRQRRPRRAVGRGDRSVGRHPSRDEGPDRRRRLQPGRRPRGGPGGARPREGLDGAGRGPRGDPHRGRPLGLARGLEPRRLDDRRLRRRRRDRPVGLAGAPGTSPPRPRPRAHRRRLPPGRLDPRHGLERAEGHAVGRGHRPKAPRVRGSHGGRGRGGLLAGRHPPRDRGQRQHAAAVGLALLRERAEPAVRGGGLRARVEPGRGAAPRRAPRRHRRPAGRVAGPLGVEGRDRPGRAGGEGPRRRVEASVPRGRRAGGGSAADLRPRRGARPRPRRAAGGRAGPSPFLVFVEKDPRFASLASRAAWRSLLDQASPRAD